MFSFTRLVTLAALALAVSANPLVERGVLPSCTNPTLLSSEIITGGVTMSTFACDESSGASLKARQTVTPPAFINVCGGACQKLCTNAAGVLPPTSEDCDTIKDAIAIFEGNQIETFNVQPGHIQSLSYLTCSYSFTNLGALPLQYCWKDLSTTASAAGSVCFPPTQPTFSEGDCKALDQTGWIVSASHSNNTASGV
ncbi:hypothetical protein OF83DRAFT_1168580 [Amylostereum chailletii]|nr:hypothetical protein OF83DRAFT_1168580 [Amylostereum chailletii]